MIASIPAASVLGAAGQPVTVEVHVGNGLPAFRIVGSPDATCRESRDRVRAAVQSCGRVWPDTQITVNLAPSGARKIGAGLDLAIAMGVLVASGQIPGDRVAGFGFVGEVGLDGSLRGVPGVAPMVAVLPEVVAVVPAVSSAEAHVAARVGVRVGHTLAEVVAALVGEAPWPDDPGPDGVLPEPAVADLSDVRGQALARSALEIAAAGGHHLLMVGPPGSGKTMLAQRLPGLLPPLEPSDSLMSTMIHSAAGMALPPGGFVTRAPLRTPHHTSSVVALVGGGSHSLRPGEISLAHAGVLFMDELGEFPPAVIDALREPLEEGVIRIARVGIHAVLPARFQLVAATNPCPCGGGPPGSCECDDTARARYLRRMSGPLLDRFDLRIPLERTSVDALLDPDPGGVGESTAVVAARVVQARALAIERGGGLNAGLGGAALDQVAPLSTSARALLRRELTDDRLTGRGYHRVRRVARTIADLAGEGDRPIDEYHVTAALALRVRLRPAAGRAA